jgi:hypothetical protein
MTVAKTFDLKTWRCAGRYLSLLAAVCGGLMASGCRDQPKRAVYCS